MASTRWGILLTVLWALLSVSCAGRVLDLRNIGVPVYIELPSGADVENKEYFDQISSMFEALDRERHIISGNAFQNSRSVFQSLDPKFNKELITEESSISSACIQDLSFLNKSLHSNSSGLVISVLKYVDASSKLPSSVLSGNWMWLGDYIECKDISPIFNTDTNKTFKGNHFVVALSKHDLKPILGQYPIMFGMCLPDSCSTTDAQGLTNTAIFYVKLFSNSSAIENLDILAISAYSVTDKKFEHGTIAYLVVSGIICFLVLLGTVIDYFFANEKEAEPKGLVANYDEPYEEHSDRTGLLSNELFTNNIQEKRTTCNCKCLDGKLLEFFKAFSLYSNGKKLFGTQTAEGPLACLNGLRVLSMFWVILGHSYAFAIAFMENTADAAKILTRFSFQPIINGTYSVDSFFFLSGLLVAYLAIKQIDEKGSLNWFYYFIHRYWRLTPLYAFVIFYFAYVFQYTFVGPLEFFADTEGQGFNQSVESCRKYWWSNLLYVNNLAPEYGSLAKTCLGWGWYLANDMQFYVIFGPVVILLFAFNKIAGLVTVAVLTLSCIITRASLVAYFGLYDENGLPTKHTNNTWAQNGVLYQRPYARYSVYVVGMLIGYILAKSHNRIRIHRLLALLGWCVATASGLAVIYGLYYYNHHMSLSSLANSSSSAHMTLVESIFYIGLGRTVWGLCLGWVVLACVSGNGSFVKDILSWKIWAPLGRLTYAAYLVHPIVIYTYNLNLRTPLYFSDLTMIYLFISNLVLSYVFAFIVSMLVEAPMIQLEKLVLVPLGRSIARPLNLYTNRFVENLRGLFRRNEE